MDMADNNAAQAPEATKTVAEVAPVRLGSLEPKAQLKGVAYNAGLTNLDGNVEEDSRRVVEADARDAFAVLTMVAMKARLGVLGGCTPEPCTRCGEWTHAYCEACVLDLGPPKAMCTTCDAAHLVCPACQGQGRSWELGRAEHEARLGRQDVLEVNGYHASWASMSNADHHFKSTFMILSRAWMGSSTPRSSWIAFKLRWMLAMAADGWFVDH